MKTIKIEMSEQMGEILQRMIADELHNQKVWLSEDMDIVGEDFCHREAIMKKLNEMAKELEAQGTKPVDYYKCY